jgi:hypothetical protein
MVNSNLTRGVPEELNQTGGYNWKDSLNGVEAYTKYNGFYGENGYKTGWRVDPGTVFTVQIGDSCRTPDLEARGVSATFTYGEYGSISAPEIWNSDEDKLSYDISVGQVVNSNLITVAAEFDAGRLVYEGSVAAAGFTVLSQKFDAATGKFEARLAFLQSGRLFSATDLAKVLTVNFAGKPGIKHDDLVEAVMISLEVSYPAATSILSKGFLPGNVFTLIENWMRWDVNRDGRLNDADLSAIIFNYYLAREGDANWAQAKAFDANKDGIVNIDDLMTIISYYSK